VLGTPFFLSTCLDLCLALSGVAGSSVSVGVFFIGIAPLSWLALVWGGKVRVMRGGITFKKSIVYSWYHVVLTWLRWIDQIGIRWFLSIMYGINVNRF